VTATCEPQAPPRHNLSGKGHCPPIEWISKQVGNCQEMSSHTLISFLVGRPELPISLTGCRNELFVELRLRKGVGNLGNGVLWPETGFEEIGALATVNSSTFPRIGLLARNSFWFARHSPATDIEKVASRLISRSLAGQPHLRRLRPVPPCASSVAGNVH
jgi:hypothetical protein